MHYRSGFTIMEIMMAVAMATFMAAIGFTGIQAFGKSITRSKQFTSESEMIVACMRLAIKQADATGSPPAISAAPSLEVPRNWLTCGISGNIVTFDMSSTLKLVSAGGGTGTNQTNVTNALNMDAADKNTLTIKTLDSNF